MSHTRLLSTLKFNPLLVYWRPKDLPEVLKGLETIPCDKLFINYFPYPYPQRITNNFFRKHTEYTHLIIIPNDLVCDVSHYNKIKSHIEKNDFEVICGVAPVDTGKRKDYWCVTVNLPSLDYDSRRYYWLSKNRYPNTLIQVPFAGHPFMTLKRSVLDKIQLWVVPAKYAGMGQPEWETRGGFASDLSLAYSLKDYGIKINCDTGIIMGHLRYKGKMLVGIKPQKVVFKKYTSKLNYGVKSFTESKIQSSS